MATERITYLFLDESEHPLISHFPRRIARDDVGQEHSRIAPRASPCQNDPASQFQPINWEGSIPKQKSLITIIRDLVQQEVRAAMESLLGSITGGKPTKHRGRKNTRGKWRPGGPGRSPKAVAAKAKKK